MEEIKLYYECSPYYGVSLHIWNVEKGDTREQFIEIFKNAIKENEWLQQNMSISEVFDFLDTLSNNLNGDDLYHNIIDNFLYLYSIHRKSYDLGVGDTFDSVVYKNKHSYSNSETISIFGLIVPYLKDKADFELWFKEELERRNKDLFLSLFDDSKSKKQLKAYLKTQIETETKSLEYYKEKYEEYKEKIEKLKKRISSLEENK